jgi:hypothetical protein
MPMQIKNRWTGAVIFECEAESIGVAVKMAIESGANLSRANLGGANLSGANLSYANLGYADLCGANLSGAHLSVAKVSGANLSGANLSYANLGYADLCGANLSYANLGYADLSGARASASTAMYWPVCPPEGDVIGWKKCEHGVIVKLLIPAAAKRSSATTRKCRAEFVQVLEVFGAAEGVSEYDEKIVYRAGETARPNGWDVDRWNECSNGIHFFITREEAEAYS